MNWIDYLGFPWCAVAADPAGGYTIYSIDECGGLRIFGRRWKPPRRPLSAPLGDPEYARRMAERIQQYLVMASDISIRRAQ